MDPPVLPYPSALWKATPRPYFVNTFAPINKNRRDIPWLVPAEVTDFKDDHAIIEEEGIRVDELLGRGTYSTVHRGYWKDYKHTVALKIYEQPRDHHSQDDDQTLPALKRVTAEVEALKFLKHPNIVGFFGAMETKYRVYLILEIVEKGNLLQYIKRHGAQGDTYLPQKWFAQLTSAVTHCHRKELAHRDIKCENILLDTQLNIRLSDFGFAMPNIIWYEDVHNEVFVKIEEYCGSLAYMAPEIVKRKPYCPILSDVWSMGIVLYGMVYGKFPYEEVNLQNIVGLAGRFKVPQQLTISPYLEDVFRRIFQIEEKRIRSYELLEKRWINQQIEAIFLGKKGDIGKTHYDLSLRYTKDINETMPFTIEQKIDIDG